MRNLIIGLSALALAAPAAVAQSSPSFPREMDAEIVRSLPHPGEVEEAADTVGRAAEAILDVPVGGIVRAIDPSRPVHPRATIEDVAGRRDPYVRERLRDSVDEIAIGMGAVAEQMAVIAPELRRSLAGIEQSLDRALGQSRRYGRDDDRRYDPDYDYRR